MVTGTKILTRSKKIIVFKVTIYETGKLFYNLLKYGTPLIYYTKYNKRIQNREWDKVLEQLK